MTEEIATSMLGLTCREFTDLAGAKGLDAFNSRKAYAAVFQDGAAPSPGFRVDLSKVLSTREETDALKFTMQLEDGLETESVILTQLGATGRPRTTLCVSSQIGCALGCTFCETAQMGLMRNLRADQIIAQWYSARFHFHQTIDNIVFMGMGEPMDNLDAVVQAIGVLTDQRGPSIAPSGISVSTVGRTEGIRRLACAVENLGMGWINLAVSLNAPNDAIRSSIMPINRAEPMAALLEAMREWSARSGRRVFIEYVLIPGVNDAPEHAEELCDFLTGLDCTVNIIPYNPRRDSPWLAPSEEDIQGFFEIVMNRGQRVTRRRTLGRTEMAGCGQLGNQHIRHRQIMPTMPSQD